MINLEDKLYTSTEVADILGVSLRSVYRYIEEDKLQAEVKTATGRHRFTKKNIIDFLYPGGEVPKEEKKVEETPKTKVEEEPKIEKEEVIETPKESPKQKPEVVKEEVREPEEVPAPAQPAEEEPIDWLEKFRMAAKRFDEESAKRVETDTGPKETFASITEQEAEPIKGHMLYYRSRLGGLKDIAQNIDKSSRNSGLDYAFSMNAGLSLFKAIKPFSILHVYVKSKDRDFFERILMLAPSDENNAQLCLMTSDDKGLYAASSELHGLFVVEKGKLLDDIRKYGDSELIEEAESILA
jgi:predicted transcriptional regulator